MEIGAPNKAGEQAVLTVVGTARCAVTARTAGGMVHVGPKENV